MLESFRVAPSKVKIVHVLYFLFLFLIWVSSCVAFGSVLLTVRGTTTLQSKGTSVDITANLDIYWNQYRQSVHAHLSDGTSTDIDSKGSFTPGWYFNDSTGDKCKPGGKAYLAFNILSFVVLLLVLLPLVIVRIFSIKLSFLSIGINRHIRIELISVILVSFFLFLATAIYGGQCFGPINDTSDEAGKAASAQADIHFKTIGKG
jgi:hypothetical protein